MSKRWWVWGLGLVLLSGGCCSQQALVKRVHDSLTKVQHFYNPLVSCALEMTPLLHQAVVAADTSLMLAGELQQRWCPDPVQARQLELQVDEAKKLAQEVGVVAASPIQEPPDAAPAK